MPIKNYTTNVDMYTSIGEIQGALARHGAAMTKSMKELPLTTDETIHIYKNSVLKGSFDEATMCAVYVEGLSALFKEKPESPFPDDLCKITACNRCGSGEYLHNEDGARNTYCGQCGQAIKWEV